MQCTVVSPAPPAPAPAVASIVASRGAAVRSSGSEVLGARLGGLGTRSRSRAPGTAAAPNAKHGEQPSRQASGRHLPPPRPLCGGDATECGGAACSPYRAVRRHRYRGEQRKLRRTHERNWRFPPPGAHHQHPPYTVHQSSAPRRTDSDTRTRDFSTRNFEARGRSSICACWCACR